jgi:hypothetical protein
VSRQTPFGYVVVADAARTVLFATCGATGEPIVPVNAGDAIVGASARTTSPVPVGLARMPSRAAGALPKTVLVPDRLMRALPLRLRSIMARSSRPPMASIGLRNSPASMTRGSGAQTATTLPIIMPLVSSSPHSSTKLKGCKFFGRQELTGSRAV